VGRMHLRDAERFWRGMGYAPSNAAVTRWSGPGVSKYYPTKNTTELGSTLELSDAFSKDVVAHEYAHSMIRKLAPEMFASGRRTPEAAALNEGLANAFAHLMSGEYNYNEDLAGGGAGLHAVFGGGPTDPHNLGRPIERAAKQLAMRVGTRAAAQIFARAVDRHLRPGSTVRGFASDVERAAVELYGPQSRAAKAAHAVGFGILMDQYPVKWTHRR